MNRTIISTVIIVLSFFSFNLQAEMLNRRIEGLVGKYNKQTLEVKTYQGYYIIPRKFVPQSFKLNHDEHIILRVPASEEEVVFKPEKMKLIPNKEISEE